MLGVEVISEGRGWGEMAVGGLLIATAVLAETEVVGGPDEKIERLGVLNIAGWYRFDTLDDGLSSGLGREFGL